MKDVTSIAEGWSEQLHLGGPLRHRRRCQVRSATSDYLWYLSISTFYQGARHHLLDLPRRGRRHGVLEGDKIISIFAEEVSTSYQVGESDQRFVVLKRSGSHYTLLCTQVIFFQKPDSDYQHKENAVFGMEELCEAFHVQFWGFKVEEEEEG